MTFYGCLEAKLYEKIKWNIVLIKKVEIFKMTSKMAVSYTSKTYMTKILDENILIVTFYECLEAK